MSTETRGQQPPAGGEMPQRAFGRTGHLRSAVTLGGIVVMNEDQAIANRVVAESLEAGVNAVDVAPTYGDAELKLGEALRGRREGVFVQCKTAVRDRQGAAAELRASLQRMQTDHFELYQFHNLSTSEDLEQIFGPGGAMEAFEEARQAGLVRFLGLSTHHPPVALQALARYDFDAVMVPANFVLHHHGQWGLDLIEEANRRGVAVQVIKPLAARPWREGEPRRYAKCWYRPFTTNRDIDLAMRYVLSLPVATAIPSGEIRLLRRAISAARYWRPIGDADRAELESRAAGLQPIFA